MVKIKDENGEEIEVLTPTEVDAKLAAEKAALEQGHTTVVKEKDEAINKLATEKSDLESKIAKMELDGVKDDHPNFKILKDALSKKDDDIKALKTEIDNDKATRKQEAMDSAIKVAAKGNDEFEKKVRLHLKETLASLPEETPEQRKVKLDAAVKLSSDSSGDGVGMFDGGIGGGGAGYGGSGGEGGSGPEFTAREKALGAKLGISAEDYKKYGGRVSKKN